jgi:hypothetical protein
MYWQIAPFLLGKFSSIGQGDGRGVFPNGLESEAWSWSKACTSFVEFLTETFDGLTEMGGQRSSF